MYCAIKLILVLVVLSTNAYQFRNEFPNRTRQANFNENQIAVNYPKSCDIDLDDYQHCFCGICKNFARTRNPSAEVQLLRKELFIVENALSVLKDDVTAIKKAPPGDKVLF